jgi:hypothetical protein
MRSSWGVAFTTADIQTDLARAGIFVFSLGGGEFGLTFTGDRPGTFGGSLDLRKANSDALSHEPTLAIDNPVGCCGGTGTLNQYIFLYYQSGSGGAGDYLASTIPEPGTGLLVALGLVALASRRRIR